MGKGQNVDREEERDETEESQGRKVRYCSAMSEQDAMQSNEKGKQQKKKKKKRKQYAMHREKRVVDKLVSWLQLSRR